MEPRLLRYFVAVAEELHLARAAERLGIEQSPVSRAMRDLESQLGVQLFDRSTRLTRLTWAGQVFLGECRRVMATVEQAVKSKRPPIPPCPHPLAMAEPQTEASDASAGFQRCGSSSPIRLLGCVGKRLSTSLR